MIPLGHPLHGGVAIVSGGTGGIGDAIVRALLGAGARVAIWSRSAGSGLTVEAARRAGPPVLGVTCDVTDPHQVQRAMRLTVARFGPPTCCVAAAGVNVLHPFPTTPFDEVKALLATNLEGAFLTLQAAAREMIRAGSGGSLLTVSSIAALRGQATTADYAASKAGVTALAREAAVHLAPYGIRSNVITPGYVDTQLLSPYLADERFAARLRERIPMRRVAHPGELGPLAVFLAGAQSAGITGTEFIVDGGYVHSHLAGAVSDC